MIENIKKLYARIEDKSAFIELCAAEFNKDPRTLANHWFSRFFSVPVKHQERVVELLQNTIRKQIKEQQELVNTESDKVE
ncbi:hypothetical protein [Aquimarina sp. 2201CG5-10]|uniref:hypothetical protein n=1 Tax=Aquimarina callyspongiae TaxID=3098150 RepID=UPI002AB5DD8F|nr:hypothetical protein [Aquimarina sp. 2201CG5-10]MDY8137607.1 hypothetical protein [Aquimarina sp. 2201CG5-10]